MKRVPQSAAEPRVGKRGYEALPCARRVQCPSGCLEPCRRRVALLSPQVERQRNLGCRSNPAPDYAGAASGATVCHPADAGFNSARGRLEPC